MKIKLLLLTMLSAVIAKGQTNCNVYKDQPHQTACQLYSEGIDFNQGSKASQERFIASLKACPTFAPTLHEMSVPYLKRGDFFTWKLLIDRAVKSNPAGYLSDRGWCLFKFLKDYNRSLEDLQRLYQLTAGQPGYTGDGDYDLRIVMALCQRERGDNKAAIQLFNECIAEHEKQQTVGLYDYLHRGVTYLRMKDYPAAIANFKLESRKYEKLADTYYYLGLTYAHLHQQKQAVACFTQAETLFTETGYHRTDPYCESPDQIYLTDIQRELKGLR